MKKVFVFSLTIFLSGVFMLSQAQQNTTPNACREATAAFQQSHHPQGSYASDVFMDSLLKVCPTLAIVWREKSVPYLKRGDFTTWYALISKAVELEPNIYLPIRGWCLIKFLHDYARGFKDLNRYDSLVAGKYKVVDDTHIKIWMALAMQGMHDDVKALRLFNEAFENTIATQGYDWIGTYDFLYRGILKLKMKDIQGAIQDFDAQITRYDKLADAYYYRGLALRELGSSKLACEDFGRAMKYYGQGYFNRDPYVEMPGQISNHDIALCLEKCP